MIKIILLIQKTTDRIIVNIHSNTLIKRTFLSYDVLVDNKMTDDRDCSIKEFC